MATVYGAPSSYDLGGIPSHIDGDPYTQNTYRSTGGFDGAYWAVENNSLKNVLNVSSEMRSLSILPISVQKIINWM